MDLGTLHKKKSIWPFNSIPAITIRGVFNGTLEIVSWNVSTVIIYLLLPCMIL